MARMKSSFVCQACGAVYSRWQGRCEACGEWNAVAEEIVEGGVGAGPKAAVAAGRPADLVPLAGETESAARVTTGIAELDRVTGGGFVMGSAVLIGGDPGIGKSTLLLQSAAALAARGKRVVYVSGEEAVAQIRLRAQRLGIAQAPVDLLSETSVEIILATLQQGEAPDLVIIDSVQTLWTDRVERAGHSDAGADLGAGADPLRQEVGRRRGAGRARDQGRADRRPARGRAHGRRRALFRGRCQPRLPHPARVKNRYGATDEIGVFEMTTLGLCEVPNPSALFLDQRDEAPPARRSSPAWKARARCCARSRRW